MIRMEHFENVALHQAVAVGFPAGFRFFFALTLSWDLIILDYTIEGKTCQK